MAVSVVAFATVKALVYVTPQAQLPSAVWFIQTALAGDATAGAATIQVDIQAKDETVYGSCEEAQLNTPLADSPLLAIDYAQALTPSQGFRMERIPDLAAIQGGRQRAYWSGFKVAIRHRLSGGQAILVTFSATNPGVGNTVDVSAWGFLWNRVAEKQPGGPVRPFGVYSSKSGKGADFIPA